MPDESIHIDRVLEEMNWLEKVIHQSIASYLMQEGHENRWYDIERPEQEKESALGSFYQEWNASIYDRLAIALAMAPHIRPEILDIFFGKNQLYDRSFTEFGGIVPADYNGFLPTAQTLSFIITAVNPELKKEFLKVIDQSHYLVKEQVLQTAPVEGYLPFSSGCLKMNKRWVHLFLTGEERPIEHSSDFPAHKITTPLAWEDVVLDDITMDQVDEINNWLIHGDDLMRNWGLEKKIKPGYRSLFYGPPGTGKTLTATLLGKSTARDVYRVDLSMISSKYIGETEKNLAKIFDIAQYKNWILFFDEADALFGRRTAANSSNDRHANQQTGYLLQRIEDFPGVIILASNLKENIDTAFQRRFQSIIHFKMPTVEERYALWQNAFSNTCQLADDIDVYQLAEHYELAGGSIINILRYCALAAIKRNDTVVLKEELLNGIRREFNKEHKTVTLKF